MIKTIYAIVKQYGNNGDDLITPIKQVEIAPVKMTKEIKLLCGCKQISRATLFG